MSLRLARFHLQIDKRLRGRDVLVNLDKGLYPPKRSQGWSDRETKMIRSELLQTLHDDNPDLRAEEIEQMVDIFFDEIAQRLAEGGRRFCFKHC